MNMTLNVQFDIENPIIEEIKIFFQRHMYNSEIDFEIKKGFNVYVFVESTIKKASCLCKGCHPRQFRRSFGGLYEFYIFVYFIFC